jgi:hypothetical protein
MQRITRHFSYANVTATLALFIALGGSSYAALQLTGRDVRNNSLTGKDVRNRSLTGRDVARNSLTGRQIRESRLGTVRNADRVGGTSALELRAICPPGTLPAANTCPETAAHPQQPFATAASQCNQAGREFGPGRRLPSIDELQALVGDERFGLGAAGELTRNVYPTGTDRLDVLVMSPNGATSTLPNTAEGARPFRCVADPIN